MKTCKLCSLPVHARYMCLKHYMQAYNKATRPGPRPVETCEQARLRHVRKLYDLASSVAARVEWRKNLLNLKGGA